MSLNHPSASLRHREMQTEQLARDAKVHKTLREALAGYARREAAQPAPPAAATLSPEPSPAPPRGAVPTPVREPAPGV